MPNYTKSATVLDVSRGLGFGILYNPVIGKTTSTQYPFVTRFRIGYRCTGRFSK